MSAEPYLISCLSLTGFNPSVPFLICVLQGFQTALVELQNVLLRLLHKRPHFHNLVIRWARAGPPLSSGFDARKSIPNNLCRRYRKLASWSLPQKNFELRSPAKAQAIHCSVSSSSMILRAVSFLDKRRPPARSDLFPTPKSSLSTVLFHTICVAGVGCKRSSGHFPRWGYERMLLRSSAVF